MNRLIYFLALDFVSGIAIILLLSSIAMLALVASEIDIIWVVGAWCAYAVFATWAIVQINGENSK